jgi:hypothetical protein
MLGGPPLQRFDGPLYERGLRRPGPNRWGYDPYSPRLEPIKVQTRRLRQPFVLRAWAHWDRETFEARDRMHPELLKRRRGRRSRRNGTAPVMVAPRQHKRGDRTALQHQFLRLLVSRADKRTGLVGRYQDGRIVPYRREDFAALVGCTLDQIDRVIADCVAAGWIFRHQGREPNGDGWRGKIAILRILRPFWEASGAEALRQAAIKREDDERQRRNQATAGELADPGAVREARRVVAELVHAHELLDPDEPRPPPDDGAD